MATLRATLEEVREALPVAGDDAPSGAAALAALERAGAMIGALQVGCCDPSRLPLYGRMLDRLTSIQIDINRPPSR